MLVPLYHIFGSEELSVLSPGVKERSPQPYLALNPADAQRLHITADAKVMIGQATIELPIKLEPSLPHGIAGIPIGLADMPKMAVPTWATLVAREVERT